MSSLNLPPAIVHQLEDVERGSLLKLIVPSVKLPTDRVPSYFWSQDVEKGNMPTFPTDSMCFESRELMRDGNLEGVRSLLHRAVEILNSVFHAIDSGDGNSKTLVTQLRLSDGLQQWRNEQLQSGNMLPHKGDGLLRVSEEVISLLNAESWSAPLLTNCAIFGSGITNFLVGAYDAETLYSNYAVDLGFYYEHGYHRVFPEFETLLEQSFNDPHAMHTPGGTERRCNISEPR